MKPKDLIIKSLQEKIAPELSKFNFKFSKSALKFSRQWNDFIHVITVSSSKWNMEDVIVEFNTGFSVTSKKFAKWYLNEYGEKPYGDGVLGIADWNLEGWKYPDYKAFFRSGFDLTEEKDRERVLDILLENIICIGIPFLENHSDWKVIADKSFSEKPFFSSRTCDLYLLAGNRARAYECLKIGRKLPYEQMPDEPAAINLRLKKIFNE